MQTNQSLTITVENGYAVFSTSDGKQNRHAIPPFASFFRTVWILLENEYAEITYAYQDCDEPDVFIEYNNLSYHWNNAFAKYTFEIEGMSEQSFADSILVESNEEEA